MGNPGKLFPFSLSRIVTTKSFQASIHSSSESARATAFFSFADFNFSSGRSRSRFQLSGSQLLVTLWRSGTSTSDLKFGIPLGILVAAMNTRFLTCGLPPNSGLIKCGDTTIGCELTRYPRSRKVAIIICHSWI